MKHKVILLLLLTLLHFSCQNKNEIYDEELIGVFDEKAKTCFFKSKNSVPSNNGFVHIELFIKLNSNEYVKTSISELASFYEVSYKKEYKYFKMFLYDIINQKIYLKSNLISLLDGKQFVINQKVLSKYKDYGIDKVLEKYFIKEDKYCMLNYNDKISKDEKLALQYYMFLNKKYFTDDCYSGITYCHDFDRYKKKNN